MDSARADDPRMSSQSDCQQQQAFIAKQVVAPLQVHDRLLLNNLPGFVYHCRNDEQWTMDFLSERCKEITGYPPAALLGNAELSYNDLIHPDDRDGVWDGVQAALRQRRPFELEYRVLHPARGERWFAERGCAIADERGAILGLTGFVEDITERKRLTLAMQASEQRFRTLFDASFDAVGVIDAAGRLQEVNDAALRMFGCQDRARFMTLLPHDLSPERQPDGRRSAEAAVEMVSVAMQQGSHDFEWLHRRLDNGELFEANVVMSRIDLDGQPALLTRIRDVSASRRYEDRLRQLAYSDPLTGLPNQQAVREWLTEHLRQPEPAPLLLLALDLDKFQWFNNTFGRHQADVVLQRFAQQLPACVGPDGLVARLQSDEFLLIRPLDSSDDAASLREQQAQLVAQVRARIAQQLSGDHELPMVPNFSCGSTIVPLQARRGDASLDGTVDDLLQEVNTALGEARDGSNGAHVVYDPKLSLVIQEQIQLESRLLAASLQNSLRIHYQPIVHRDGEIHSAEALMRWQQPDGCFISPDLFIPMAERNGLIRDLGAWLIEASCAQLAQWRRQDLPLAYLSINVSPAQLQSPDRPLLGLLLAAIERHQLPPHVLQLEITETAVLDNLQQASQELQELADAGFRLALDDFGTGYSSLVTLQQLPFDALKIDKSFVQSIETQEKSRALVEACVSLARKLQLRCIAEGVDSERQCQLLMRMGCEYFQGFMFDAGLAPADFEANLRFQARAERPL